MCVRTGSSLSWNGAKEATSLKAPVTVEKEDIWTDTFLCVKCQQYEFETSITQAYFYSPVNMKTDSLFLNIHSDCPPLHKVINIRICHPNRLCHTPILHSPHCCSHQHWHEHKMIHETCQHYSQIVCQGQFDKASHPKNNNGFSLFTSLLLPNASVGPLEFAVVPLLFIFNIV